MTQNTYRSISRASASLLHRVWRNCGFTSTVLCRIRHAQDRYGICNCSAEDIHILLLSSLSFYLFNLLFKSLSSLIPFTPVHNVTHLQTEASLSSMASSCRSPISLFLFSTNKQSVSQSISSKQQSKGSFLFFTPPAKATPLGGGQHTFSERKFWWARVSVKVFVDLFTHDFPQRVPLRKPALNFLITLIRLHSACL